MSLRPEDSATSTAGRAAPGRTPPRTIPTTLARPITPATERAVGIDAGPTPIAPRLARPVTAASERAVSIDLGSITAAAPQVSRPPTTPPRLAPAPIAPI